MSTKNWSESVVTLTGHTQSVTCLELVSDTVLASGSEDGTIRIWSWRTGQQVRVIVEEKSPAVLSLRLVSHSIIASGTGDGFIHLHNVNNGECTKTLGGNRKLERVDSLEVMSTGSNQCFASFSMDKTIRLWNVTSGECLTTIYTNVQMGKTSCFKILQ